MASKFGLAGGIPERRVRPIWDAVDSRQFKAALKLSTALLSKYPNSSYALALKALILERMGKPDEALGVCLNAKEELYSSDAIQIDDLTLSTLQIVFQRLDRLDLATSCYEHACAKFPNNLDLMMGLFNCYIREYSFVKQQQTAIKMYKIVGEERFLLWAVCSIQLQVFCTNGGEKLLSLAEALLKKHIASHSLHEPEALLIYISILEQQAKYGAALEILSGKLGSLIVIELDKLRMQGRLLARACDYVAAAEIFQNVLELCPDDWESFLHYLGCLLEEEMSWSEGSTGDQNHLLKDLKVKHFTRFNEEVFDSRISSALSFVQKLQMEINDDSVRCPYLANIEIEKQRRLYGKADDGKYMEALLKYFCRFCHLSSFASDVEMFLHVLTHDEKNELLEKFMEISGSFSMSPVKALGQAITIFKIQELLGVMFRLPNGELYGTAIRMVKMFFENLTLSKDLDPQENMYGEELLSMGCNVLVQLFWRTRHLGYLLEAIVVLEFGLAIRRYVWQYKILLLHLYSYLGAIPLAYEWYGTLEIKNILFETTSHHIMPEMLRSPLWSDVSDFIKEYLKFMDDYMREAADLAFLACRHRSYSKVIEFVQFKERLQHSHQYLMATIEATILRLKQSNNNLEEVECTLESVNCGVQLLRMSNEEECKSLTFNEDLQSRPWWTPTSNLNYLSGSFNEVLISHKAEMFKLQSDEKVAVVREVTVRRSLLPRLVYLSLQVPSYVLKENFETDGSSTCDPKSCSELKRLLERYSMSLGHPFDDAIKIILEVAEGRYSVKELGSDLVHWMSFAVFVNAWNLCSCHPGLPNGAGPASNSWNIVDGLVEKCTTEQLNSLKPILTCPGSSLPVLFQLVTESYSWHILVIQSFIRSMLPSGKKKRRSGVVDQLNSPLLEAIQSSIRSLSSVIEDVKKWLYDQINRPEDENLDVLLSHLQRSDCDVGPGRVCQVIEEEAASAGNSDVGDRITQALRSWCSVDVVRKIIGGQCTVLSEFHSVCESKLKLLDSLKLSL